MTRNTPSETAYFHDQKGRWHEPHATIVPKYSPEVLMEQPFREKEKNDTAEVAKLISVLARVRGDEAANKMISGIIEKCTGYLNIVAAFKALKARAAEMETRDFQAQMKELDQNRRIKHNALIQDMKIYRRHIVSEYGDEDFVSDYSIYTGTSSDRSAIGGWAMALAAAVAELPENHRLKKELRTEE